VGLIRPQESRPQEPPSSADRSSTANRANDQSGERFPSGALITSSDDYRIGPNDVIDIRVDKAPEISGMFRVNSTGTILVNYLGRISAQNKTPEELAKVIADGLRGDYLKDPHVVIEVKQYNSRSFFIQGSVRNPGIYHIEGPPSLMKLIIIAGGLADNHGSTAFIIRELKPEASENLQTSDPPVADAEPRAKYELLKRNINGLLKGAFDQDIIIEPGDVVNIPSTEVFFVAGEVHAPGSFPLKEGTSLRQAISLAQGTMPNAALKRGIIFREDPVSGKREEIRVDIADVMKGKKEDVAILPNDTVIVPSSRWKSLSNTMLSSFGVGFIRMGRLPGRL
jgi:polysaccharide export outer membrane protein